MGYKAGEHSVNRKRRARERALEREIERFEALEEITADSETYDLSQKECWDFFKEKGWRYSREHKSFFAPPEGYKQHKFLKNNEF